jgi:uncharacterized protein
VTDLRLHLMQYDEDIAVARLEPGESPHWNWRTGPLQSITATNSETSVICAHVEIPTGVTVQGPLRGFEIAGPLDFSMVGVMSGLLEPVARKGIAILAISTYDTDWILVRAEQAEEAAVVWRRHGHTVMPARLSAGGSS